MKKFLIIIFLGTFVFTLLPISTSHAKDGDGTTTTTSTTSITSSNEAERSASTAAMAGITTSGRMPQTSPSIGTIGSLERIRAHA